MMMHTHWQGRKDQPQIPGGFNQAEDELVFHALQRLSDALPGRTECEIAHRLSMMAGCRAEKGVARPVAS